MNGIGVDCWNGAWLIGVCIGAAIGATIAIGGGGGGMKVILIMV